MGMERILLGTLALLIGLFAGGAQAAVIYLTDAADGDDLLELGLDCETGVMDVRLDTSAVDTVKVAFLNLYLDSTDSGVQAFEVEHGLGPPFVYECEYCNTDPPIDGQHPEAYYLTMGGYHAERRPPSGSGDVDS